MRGEIIGKEGNVLKVKVFDEIDFDELKMNRVNNRYFVHLDPFKKDDITDLQRKHYFALLNDFSIYTGYPVDAIDDFFKVKFMEEENLDDYPSLAVGQMKKTTASKLLEMVITFMIQKEIPFRKDRYYLTMDQSKMLFALTMKRICWISGRRGEIHHATNLIGMGRNRKTHKHEESTFMCLSREYHIEIHNIGYDAFCKKYHVQAIRLSKDNLRELGLL